MKTVLQTGAGLALGAWPRFVILAAALSAPSFSFVTPTVGGLSGSPTSIPAGVSTAVTVTVSISAVSPLPGGVNLLQEDASGTTLGTLGVMHDDGLNGDAVAGDGIFTLVVSLTPPSSATAIYLQATAAFKGLLQRVKSPVLTVPVTTAGTPAVTGFSPSSGPVGTLVKVNLSKFTPPQGTTPLVTLAALNGGSMSAPVSAFTATSLSFVVPTGAGTGKIGVAFGSQSATSANAFSVTTSTGFTVSVGPSTANLFRGQSVTYAVKVNSPNGFDGLATLSVSGLPSGVTSSFKPSAVTANQTSVLTLSAPATQAASTATLTVTASATIEGQAVSHSQKVALQVTAISTSFIGRTVVDDAQQTPIGGVTVKFLGKDSQGNVTGCTGQTLSDVSGNFQFTSLTTACTGPQLISYDGSTATSPAGKYAGVNLSYTLTSGQVTTSPVLIHLPRIDNAETVQVQQNFSADQVFNFQSIPGLVVTVYAGTTFSLDDGSKPNPFPLIAIEVPVDRLPDQMATSGKVMPFIVAFQPANAVSSQPVAVNFPNSLNLPPGGAATFMTLDPTRGYMVPYGSGSVSTDGTKIVADPDPAHPGHGYGLVHFDWHGPSIPSAPSLSPGPDAGGGPSPQSPPPQSPPTSGGTGCRDNTPNPPQCLGGDPVDLASGLVTYTSTDLVIRGGRGSIGIVRTYRTLSNNPGPLGPGTGLSYSYALNTAAVIQGQGGVITLATPNGAQFPLSIQQDGTFVNTTAPFLTGAVLTVNSSFGTYILRWRDGTTYTFQISALGGLAAYLTAITDPNQNTISLTLNPSQPLQVTQITDPVGRSITVSYDSSNRITSASDPIGRRVSYTYNSAGLLSTFTDAVGGVTTYAYDPQNNLKSVTDPNQVLMQQNLYDVDNGGRVISQIEANGGTFYFTYTLQNPAVPTSPVLQTDVIDPLGNKTTYRFDAKGFPLSAFDPLGQARTLQRDPAHNNLVQSYAGTGNCSVCGNPAVGDVSYVFDSVGNVLKSTDALGNTSSYTYDAVFNKVTSITDPLNHTTSFTYDSAGNLTSVTDANNKKTSYTYSFGEVTQITDALGNVTIFSYDPTGNLSTITDALGNVTSFVYDAVSRQTQVFDALNRKSTSAYDAMDRVTSTTDHQNNTTQFGYDLNGNLLSLTDANNNKTSFTYDDMNRLLNLTDPLNNSDTRTYDKNQNLIRFVDRRAQTSQFVYDRLNRLVAETYSDGSSVARTYDANGRLTNETDSFSGAFDYTYDAVGRLLSTANQFGAIQYSYDNASRLTSRQVLGQSAVQYSYDNGNNVTAAAMPQASASFIYDSDNRIATINRLNGVSSHYGYDIAGNLLSITHSGGMGVNVLLAYAYDAVRNRTSYNVATARPLITQASASTYNQDNQLTTSTSASATTSYNYDKNANILSVVTATGTTSYTWDARNRLTSIVQPNGQSTNFLYDSGRTLLRQTGSGPALNDVITLLTDAFANVAYISRSNGDGLSILTGLGIDQTLAVVHSSGQLEYGLTDAINSTIVTADQSGAAKGVFSYEPFGQTTVNGTDYPFQFTGRVPVLGSLYYNRARFYDSQTGRFISEDPLGLAGGLNLYRYVGNRPTIFTDPSGLRGPCVEWASFGGVPYCRSYGYDDSEDINRLGPTTISTGQLSPLPPMSTAVGGNGSTPPGQTAVSTNGSVPYGPWPPQTGEPGLESLGLGPIGIFLPGPDKLLDWIDWTQRAWQVGRGIGCWLNNKLYH